MKICIFTLPLRNNYGGLLQAYALQQILSNMGHFVFTDNQLRVFTFKEEFFLFRLCRLIKKYVFKQKNQIISYRKYNLKICQNLNKFIVDNIRTTDFSKEIFNCSYDAFIVGSDQVWRRLYNPNQERLFLDFSMGMKVKRIAYAASFGVDNMDEYDDCLIVKCAKLLQSFDSVSVRESSAVKLCVDYFNVSAKHVLDPTMLLDISQYLNLTSGNKSIKQELLTCYLLDENSEKMAIVDKIQSIIGGRRNNIMVKSKNPKDGLDLCTYPSIDVWLSGFRDAKFVVTDSFHGVVFSIIFNKPFVAIANRNRGLDRFMSLLKMFYLEERLLYSIEEISDVLFNDIDYTEVNKILAQMRRKSLEFLNYSLANECS